MLLRMYSSISSRDLKSPIFCKKSSSTSGNSNPFTDWTFTLKMTRLPTRSPSGVSSENSCSISSSSPALTPINCRANPLKGHSVSFCSFSVGMKTCWGVDCISSASSPSWAWAFTALSVKKTKSPSFAGVSSGIMVLALRRAARRVPWTSSSAIVGGS